MLERTIKRNVTIYDIAKEANVSAATVSRVLNKTTNVKSDKEKMILELVEKYSFVPNNSARSLSNRNSKTIGIIIPDIRNAYYANLQTFCEKEADRLGYHLLLANTLGENEHMTESIQNLICKSVDGIVQLGGSVDRVEINRQYLDIIDKITEKIPYVSTGNIEKSNCSSVRCNEYKGAGRLTEYLIQKGHKKILFLGGIDNVLSTADKWKAFKDIMKKHQLTEQSVIQPCRYEMEDGYQAMMEYWECHINKPTALICINELVAIGAVHASREIGIAVPGDLSITAFDNTYLSRITMPRLTGMGYNYEKYAKEIISKMVNEIEGRPYKTKVIDLELVERDSVSDIQTP